MRKNKKNGDWGRRFALPCSLMWVAFVLTTSLAHAQKKNDSASAAAATVPHHRPVLFNGEVQAVDAFPVTVPSTNMNPSTIRFYLPEGSKVKKGDVVLRVESQGESDIERIELEMVQARQRGDKEIADLEVKVIEAERALAIAKSAFARAKIDAALPKTHIAPLDYDRYQGEKNRAEGDVEVKQKMLDNAKGAVARKSEDNELIIKRSQIQIAYAKSQQTQSEVRSPKDGILIHGFDAFSGKRLDEGGRAFIGSTAGQILGDGKLHVIAWVLESDRLFLKDGQTVSVRFDAIPGSLTQGTVARIASAPEQRAIWGSGKYFKVEITLPELGNLALQQGMSAAIEVGSGVTQKTTNGDKVKVNFAKAGLSSLPKVNEILIEGEVLSRVSRMISPPAIQQVWQYNLVMLAPEGSQVKTGQAVAIFEANEVKTRLESSRSQFKERQRSLEKLILDHAEATKAAELAVNEAKSNFEKASRKASTPKELVKRVDYDKLVIEKDLAQQSVRFSENQRDALKRAREAELRGVKSEMATLQSTIDILERGKKNLTVLAPREGTVIHSAGFDDEKFAVGSKVWMGSSVASLADPEKIFVLAKVPEAQISLVKVGQKVAVTVPGSSDIIAARVHAMGAVFHGKSRNQPNIVRDIELEFEQLPKNVKPGTAVQVKINSSELEKSATKPTSKLGSEI